MEDSYFQKALSTLASNTAYGDAIRHMHDSGLTVEEIYEKLDYPVSIEKIKTVIDEYEEKKLSGETKYEYVMQQDKFGRRNFIKVKKD